MSACSYPYSPCAREDRITSLEAKVERLTRLASTGADQVAELEKQVEALTAENTELQAQVDALQQKVHLCAGYDKLVAENTRLVSANVELFNEVEHLRTMNDRTLNDISRAVSRCKNIAIGDDIDSAKDTDIKDRSLRMPSLQEAADSVSTRQRTRPGVSRPPQL